LSPREDIDTDESLYGAGFRELIKNLNQFLCQQNSRGMLMIDARSDLHSSVQDRRLLNVYREWVSTSEKSRFVEIPWFGFSSFYVGLQLADYIAYSVAYDIEYTADLDQKSQRNKNIQRNTELQQVFSLLKQKVRYSEIP
jgi:hypothetical protein